MAVRRGERRHVHSPDRMASVLAVAGENGWELVSIYDKSSNWFQGFEKGFMLLKRPVPKV